jgi:hypothetical protein
VTCALQFFFSFPGFLETHNKYKTGTENKQNTNHKGGLGQTKY